MFELPAEKLRNRKKFLSKKYSWKEFIQKFFGGNERIIKAWKRGKNKISLKLWILTDGFSNTSFGESIYIEKFSQLNQTIIKL